MSEWIQWDGGERPVGADVVVEVRTREGQQEKDIGLKFSWAHYWMDSDIVAYKIADDVTEPCCAQPQRCGRDCSTRKRWLGGELTETQEQNLEKLRKAAEEKYKNPITPCPPLPTDSVNHPQHYTAGKVECIDALESATVNLSGIEAVCTANAIKYLWRWKQKNGVEDLRKARWYLDRMIEKMEGGE